MSNLLDDYSNLGEKPPRPLGIFVIIKYLLADCNGSFTLAIITSILFWTFGINSEIIHFSFTNKTWIETTGIIQRVVYANAKTNKQKIYKYEFTYEIDGRTLEGKSHSTYFEKEGKGKIVTIFYNASNPNRAIIQGMKTEIFDYLTGFLVLVLPGILTLRFLLGRLWKNILFLQLLKNGVFTIAKTSCKEAPKSKFNIGTYDFDFEIKGIKYKTNFIGVKNEIVDSGKVLYLPNYSKTHIPLAKLADSKVMDKFGQIEEVDSSALSVFTLPIIITLINLLGWYLH